jgi:steroid delta-isomerase-like uncharacterized protein
MEGVMSEQNKDIVRRSFEELFTEGKLEVADDVFAADYVGHDPAMPRDIHGPEEFKNFVRLYRTAFPDLRLVVEEQVAEGDLVVTRFTAVGTHRGELMGIPPTGAKVTVSGISIDRMEGGKSVESWTNYDALNMLRQIGALPSLKQGEQPAEGATARA